MKKLIAVLLGALLLVNIVACAVPVEETGGTTTTSATTTATSRTRATFGGVTTLPPKGGATSQVTTTQSTTPTTDDRITPTQTVVDLIDSSDAYLGMSMEIFSGGIDVYADSEKHGGSGLYDDYLEKTIGEEEINAYTNEWQAKLQADRYANPGNSVQKWLLDFKIPRETAEAVNEDFKKAYAGKEEYAQFVYTDEEINDIYTLTAEQYNQKYKAPTAVAVGSKLYSFAWFIEKPVDLWLQYGFTPAQIGEIVANGKKAGFPSIFVEKMEKKCKVYTAIVQGEELAAGEGEYSLPVYVYANPTKFNGMHGSLYTYIRENFDAEKVFWLRNDAYKMKKFKDYSNVGESPLWWVCQLKIPREKFVELNEQDKENYKDRPWVLENFTFTDEEIDDIYNLTIEEFNQKYKAPTAVLKGEILFSFNWLYKCDVQTWQSQELGVEDVQAAVAAAKVTHSFSQDMIKTVEEKLDEYMQLESQRPPVVYEDATDQTQGQPSETAARELIARYFRYTALYESSIILLMDELGLGEKAQMEENMSKTGLTGISERAYEAEIAKTILNETMEKQLLSTRERDYDVGEIVSFRDEKPLVNKIVQEIKFQETSKVPVLLTEYTSYVYTVTVVENGTEKVYRVEIADPYSKYVISACEPMTK